MPNRTFTDEQRQQNNARARAWALANPDAVKTAQKRYREKHALKRREKHAARMRAARAANPEKYAEISARHNAKPATKIRRRLNAAKRDSRIRRAVAPWADFTKIAEIYELATLLSIATDEQHEVDHIYPLFGRNSCGLHVENNLQILTARENRKKSNRL